MSHFTILKTRLVDADMLIRALNDLGFPQVEIHRVPQGLFGYQGDLRPEKAEIIIRRQFISSSSNDIGFRMTSDGTFEAIISEFDRDIYSQDWLNRLTQRYAYHVARSRLEAQGFDLVSEETHPDGQVHLVLRRAR